MNFHGIGDLASTMIARRSNVDLRTELQRLTQEVGSGVKADISAATGGNLAPLSALKSSISLLDAYEEVSSRVSINLDYIGIAVDGIREEISGLGASLLANSNTGDVNTLPIIAGAADAFQNAISALSVQVAGQYVFSGISTDQQPLASADDMLESVNLAASAATTAADYYQLVDDWFTQIGGGFDLMAYEGGSAQSQGIKISETAEYKSELTAEAIEFRKTLRDLAIVTLVDRGAFSNDPDQRRVLMNSVGEALLGNSDELTSVRASVGEQQQRLADAKNQNQSQAYLLEHAKDQIVGVDLYEAASRLEEVQIQLESLYLVTAKTSRLNLTEFLR